MFKDSFKPFVLGGLLLACSTLAASALVTLDLGGANDQYDEWYSMTSANYPGRTSTAWSNPIGSALGGDANLDVVARVPWQPSPTGPVVEAAPYPASFGLYGGFWAGSDENAGTLGVFDATPVAGVKTIVFQLELGEADGNSFYNDVYPILRINNGTILIGQSTFNGISSAVQSGVFNPPGDDPDQGDVPLYTNTWFFQWDLSELGIVIENFSIEWTSVGHTSTYAMQLDQSAEAHTSALIEAIPEPSANLLALVGVAGVLGLGVRRRRR